MNPSSDPYRHDVMTFGEAMAMFVADSPGDLAEVGHFTKRVAGADNNVATGLARLGLRVAWVSRVGDDSFGRFIVETLSREGIDCARVTVDPKHPTGFQLKSMNPDGSDPRVEYFRRGSAASHLTPADFDPAFFLGARHLHATGIPPAISDSAREFSRRAMSEMRAAGRSVSFDPNLRPSLWPSRERMVAELNSLAELADWVLPGLEEGRLLTGRDSAHDVAGFYLERGASIVVIKLGPEGAYWRTKGEEGTVPGVPVERVVDTVGAGDAFAVGVVSALLEGASVPAAVARGTRLGALAVQVPGDSEGLPTRAELERLESRSA